MQGIYSSWVLAPDKRGHLEDFSLLVVPTLAGLQTSDPWQVMSSFCKRICTLNFRCVFYLLVGCIFASFLSIYCCVMCWWLTYVLRIHIFFFLSSLLLQGTRKKGKGGQERAIPWHHLQKSATSFAERMAYERSFLHDLIPDCVFSLYASWELWLWL